MVKKLKYRLQLSFEMTAEVEVCDLIEGIWAAGFYAFPTEMLLRPLPQNSGAPVPVSPSPRSTRIYSLHDTRDTPFSGPHFF